MKSPDCDAYNIKVGGAAHELCKEEALDVAVKVLTELSHIWISSPSKLRPRSYVA